MQAPALRIDLGQTGTRGFLPDGEPFFVRTGLQYGDTVAIAVERALADITPQHADIALLSVSGMRGRLTGVGDVASVVRTWSGAYEIGVCDDGIAWNLGALDGQDGVVLAAGGGVVAVARAGGRLRHVDGCGADLGDDGGASWLGRKAIRAAMRSVQERGQRTEMVEALDSMIGPVLELPYRYLTPAQFHESCLQVAQLVLTMADQDDVAARICSLGAQRLAATAVSAASILVEQSRSVRFALCGGLMNDRGYRSAVEQHVTQALPDAHFHDPIGDALDGLALLAQDFSRDVPPLVEWVRH